MISVDTNVVVRLLVGDHPEQSAQARALFERNEILITSTVLLETEWVLRSAYRFKPAAVHDAIQGLLGLDHVAAAEPARIEETLVLYSRGADFADALHVVGSVGADQFATFDRALIRTSDALDGSLEIIEP